MPGSAKARGQLEREILACLAAATGALTPSEVLAELGRPLAYTTVMTTLARLHDKHAVIRSQRGRAYAYALVGGTDDAANNVTAHQMHRILEAGSDRAGVLARFVAELSPSDERMLNELLARPEDGR
jgi:predicted transcriptional regulator